MSSPNPKNTLRALLPGGPDYAHGKREFSVVYTDRALNHMSQQFQYIMKDINTLLKEAYNCDESVIIPGSGTYGMEACARAFAEGKKALVIRNGYFSFRWSQIFEAAGLAASEVVLRAEAQGEGNTREFAPVPVAEAVRRIEAEKPDVVFAPHVETSSGMILPDSYLKAIGDAVHKNGGIFVLDCIASGCVWVDTKALGIDVVISAPQKGWSGPACCAFVTLSAKAVAAVEAGTGGSSFATNLKAWRTVMQAYVSGEGPGHKYYTTMPTDALVKVRNAMAETAGLTFARAKELQIKLGREVRAMMASKGFKSVAAPDFAAPGVVVLYAPSADFASRFGAYMVQIAGGVPLMVGQGTDTQSNAFRTFRLGLFGIDKLLNIERMVSDLASVVDSIQRDINAAL